MTVTLVEELGADTYVYGTYAGPDGPVDLVARLRAALYPPLAGIANAWATALGEERRFPATLAAYTAQKSPGESFVAWIRRHSVKALQEKLST